MAQTYLKISWNCTNWSLCISVLQRVDEPLLLPRTENLKTSRTPSVHHNWNNCRQQCWTVKPSYRKKQGRHLSLVSRGRAFLMCLSDSSFKKQNKPAPCILFFACFHPLFGTDAPGFSDYFFFPVFCNLVFEFLLSIIWIPGGSSRFKHRGRVAVL